MIVAYGRPFSPGRGNLNFPERLLQYNTEEKALHERLLKHRKEDYAHTDADNYEVIPLKGKFGVSVQTLRDVRFSSAEIELFLNMTASLLKRVNTRMEEIRLSGI